MRVQLILAALAMTALLVPSNALPIPFPSPPGPTQPVTDAAIVVAQKIENGDVYLRLADFMADFTTVGCATIGGLSNPLVPYQVNCVDFAEYLTPPTVCPGSTLNQTIACASQLVCVHFDYQLRGGLLSGEPLAFYGRQVNVVGIGLFQDGDSYGAGGGTYSISVGNQSQFTCEVIDQAW